MTNHVDGQQPDVEGIEVGALVAVLRHGEAEITEGRIKPFGEIVKRLRQPE